jgi:hypothetical protein
MAGTDVKIGPEDVLTVRTQPPPAPAAGATQQATEAAAQQQAPRIAPPQDVEVGGDLSEVPDEILARAYAIVNTLSKTLRDGDAAQAAAIAAATPAGVTVQAASTNTSVFPWDIATAGPYNLDAPLEPPWLTPNQVIPIGHFAAMIGISYAAAPFTRAYLALKPYDARFTCVNISECKPGLPVGSLSFPPYVVPTGAKFAGVFGLGVFRFFLWIFRPNLVAGSDQDLFEVNFTITIPPFGGRLGAGFSEYNWDPNKGVGLPIGVPALGAPPNLLGVAPHWQEESATRFMVSS